MHKTNPEELRAAILQAAIQGKLIPQNPNDEPASVLLDHIQQERTKLVKDGKLKRNKHKSFIFSRDNHYYENVDGEESCIDKQIPFDIPESWNWVRLGQLVTKLGSGSTPCGGKHAYKEKGIPFIRSQNVYNDGLRLNNVAYIDEKTNDAHIGSVVKPNDLLLNITGGSIGRCCIVPESLSIANVSQHVMIVRPIDSRIKEFIHLVICSPYFFNKIMELQVGATKEGLSATSASKMLVPIAPLSEQKQILEKVKKGICKLNELDTLYHAFTKLNMSLEGNLKSSIIQFAIQGKLVPQDPNDEPVKIDCKHPIVRRDNSYYQKIGHEEVCIDEQIPFKIPDNWTFVRFSDAVKFKLGKTPPRSTDAYWKDGTIPWISIADMKDMSTTDDTKEKITKKAFEDCFTSFCEKGTLLMSFKLSIGKITIAGMNCVHNEAIISIIPHSNITQEWLMTCLPTISSNVKGEEAIKGNTLNKKTLSDMVIPVPPVKEQQRICHKTNILMQCLKNIDVF